MCDNGDAAQHLVNTILFEAIGSLGADQALMPVFFDRLVTACRSMQKLIPWIVSTAGSDIRSVHAGASAYLEMWGALLGGWMHYMQLRAALRSNLPAETVAAVKCSAQFFAMDALAHVPAIAQLVRSGTTPCLEFSDSHW